MKISGLGVAAMAAAMSVLPVHAAETPLTYDRVDLSTSAQSSVDNDILVAYLSRQMEGASAAPLAEQVSKSVAQSIKLIKQSPEVKIQTMDYQTSPIYQDDRIIGWRVRQSLRLESNNFAKLSGLLGDLQHSLNLDSIEYEVSPEKMKQAEEALTEQALLSFQQRADKITKTLGRNRFRIVSLQIMNPIDGNRPPMMSARPMAAERSMAPPPLEPGERKVRVNVSGTIELQTD